MLDNFKYIQQITVLLEAPKDCLYKGQTMQLDIDIPDVKKSDSNSYPGLPAVYNWYHDEIFIPELTKNTFYNNHKVFFTKELKDDGTFKRWIKWEWRKT